MNNKSLSSVFLTAIMVCGFALTNIQFANTSDDSSTSWVKTYGGPYGGFIRSIIQTPDGGYALVGSYIFERCYPYPDGENSWFIKIDSSGETVLDKEIDLGLNDQAIGIIQTSDGGYLILGDRAGGFSKFIANSGSGEITVPKTFYMARLDSSGNLLSNETYGGTPIAIAQSGNCDFALLRYSDSLPKVVLNKFGSNLNLQWSIEAGKPQIESSFSLISTDDNGFAVAQRIVKRTYVARWVEHVETHVRLIKLDSQGNVQLNKTIEISSPTDFCSFVQTNDGGYLFAGGHTYPGTGHPNVWLLKTDSDANVEWTKTALSGTARSITKTFDGGYALAVDDDPTSLNIVKVDVAGNMQWIKRYNGTTLTWKIIQTSDGGYATVSKVVFEGNYDPYGLFIKADATAGDAIVPTPAPDPTPTPTPPPTSVDPVSPTPSPTQEPPLTPEPLEAMIGAAIAVAVIGAGLGLLIYLIKRK